MHFMEYLLYIIKDLCFDTYSEHLLYNMYDGERNVSYSKLVCRKLLIQGIKFE